MAPTYTSVFLVLIIVSAATGSTARVLTSTSSQKEFGQQKGDNDGDGSGGGLPSSGGSYGSISEPGPDDGSNAPGDTGGDGSGPIDGSGSGPIDGSGSNPIPTMPWIGGGPTDHMPIIPKLPGPTDHMPIIPKLPGPTDHMPIIPKLPGPFPGHGTCDFWKSNFGSWPNMVSTMSTIGSIFGKPASSMFPSSMTLLEALQNGKNDAYSTLLKQASASLLNSYAHKNFVYSPEDIKSLVGAALTSPKAAAAQATQFARANLSV